MPQRPATIDPLDALLRDIDNEIGPATTAPDPMDALLADIDSEIGPMQAQPTIGQRPFPKGGPAGGTLTSGPVVTGPSLEEVVAQGKSTKVGGRDVNLPIEAPQIPVGPASVLDQIGYQPQPLNPPPSPPSMMDVAKESIGKAATWARGITPQNRVGKALEGIATGVSTLTGAVKAIPSAIGETVFDQPLPGHQGEPDSFFGKLTEHAKLILSGQGGSVEPIGAVRALINPPDSVETTAPSYANTYHTDPSPEAGSRTRGRKEMLALETGRRGLDIAARLLTDPVAVAASAVPGAAGQAVAAAFSMSGIQAAVQTASDPKATPEDVAEAVLGAAIQTIPLIARPAVTGALNATDAAAASLATAARNTILAVKLRTPNVARAFEHTSHEGIHAPVELLEHTGGSETPPPVGETVGELVRTVRAPEPPPLNINEPRAPRVQEPTVPSLDTVVAAIDAEIGQGPVDATGRELGGYAGPERRSPEARETGPDADARYQAMREKIAAGEPTGTEEARADFAERQRVEQTLRQGATEEVSADDVVAQIDDHLADVGKPDREFSSTQVEIPAEHANAVRELAQTIPDEALAEDGRETRPHVTLKFGLHTNDAADVQKLLADEPPITVRLGKTSVFPAKEGADYDVVKVDVDSPDLHRLNAKIAGALEHTDTHPDYRPHITLAYVKPGLGKQYADNAALEGREVTIHEVTFSGQDRTETSMPLGGQAPSSDIVAQIDQHLAGKDTPTTATAPSKPVAELSDEELADRIMAEVDGPKAPEPTKGRIVPYRDANGNVGYRAEPIHDPAQTPATDQLHDVGVARAKALTDLERTGTAHRNGVTVKLVREDANAHYRVEVVRDGNRDFAVGQHAHQADAIESAVNALFYEPPAKPSIPVTPKKGAEQFDAAARGTAYEDMTDPELRELLDIGVGEEPSKAANEISRRDMATKGDGTVFKVGDRVRFTDGDREVYLVKGIHPNGIRVEHEGEPGVGKAVSPVHIELVEQKPATSKPGPIVEFNGGRQKGRQMRVERQSGDAISGHYVNADGTDGGWVATDIRNVRPVTEKPASTLVPPHSLTAGGVEFTVQPLKKAGGLPVTARKPVTPQLPPAGGGTKYVLPTFATGQHVKVTENKAKRDAIVEKLKAKFAKQAERNAREDDSDDDTPVQSMAIDRETVTAMVGIARSYLADGVTSFEAATLQLREEYGEPFLKQIATHWETGWRMLGQESGSVADILAKADETATAAAAKADMPVTITRGYDNEGKALTTASGKLYEFFKGRWPDLPKNNTELKALITRALPDVDPSENSILNAATDAIEAVLAKYLGGPNMADAHKLEAMLTRAYRTPEKMRLQQFSTPLPIAVAGVQAAQIRRADRVLEPTAGTGNLLAPITPAMGVAVTAMELDPSRVALLKAQGWNAVEANYLTAPLTKDAYHVIITNPPWGKYTTGKYGRPIAGDFTPGDVAERFIAKNVRELKPGGRLVAVMPTTMLGPSGVAFRGFLDKHGSIRAVIKSPPNAYDTRGTSVESVLLVFDKGGATLAPGEKIVQLDTKDWEAYTEAVGRIAARAELQRTGVIPVTPKAEQRPAGSGAGSAGPRSGGVPKPAGDAVRPQPGRPADVVAPVQPGHVRPVGESEGDAERPARAAGEDATRGLSETSLDAFRSAERSERFSPYRLRTTLNGVRHPRVMVEARGLAGVEYPPLTYHPSARFERIIADGRASIEQAEQALAAVQANIDGHHGYLAADNVGVGKAREAWLAIIELMERAKKEKRPLRLMVTTKNADNIASLIQGELPALVGDDPGFEVIKVADYKGSRQKPGKSDPIEPLPQAEHGVYVVDSYNIAPYREALLDVGLHGIVGDEAHRFKNAGASVGAAWQQIHGRIFESVPRDQQAFVYFTATPAQAVEDYAYLYGLRMWPIDGFQDWVDMVTGQATEEQARETRAAAEAGGFDIKAVSGNAGDSVVGGDSEDTARGERAPQMGGGDVFSSRLTPAEGEQITREWKRLGRFSSRDLWREGTEFVVKTEKADEVAVQRYDDFTSLARDIIDAATKFGRMNKAVRSGIGGVKSQLQFAAKRVQMQPSLEAAVRLAQEYITTGHQVVLSMINVSEFDAEQGNIAAAIHQINIHDIDVTNDGETIDNGEIPEALQARAELMEKSAELGKLPSPVTFIEEALGAENVAFVIGQSKGREKHVAEFQEGKRQVAVISAAGSTGISLDHRVETPGKAKGRRVFIDVQFDWSATEAIQRYGRVDRASQISAPKIIALNFGTAAEKKFLSTIANRLASLGALSKGGSETTGTDLEEFEIDGNEASAAARNAWDALPDETKDLFRGRQFRDSRNPTYPAKNTSATIKDVMLSLLFVPTREANAFWSDFIVERDRLREMQTAGLERRTNAAKGEVLRTLQLTPELTLYQVKNANNERMGILSGVVMPEMPRIRDFLRDSNSNISRRYTAFTAGDQVVAGLIIPWGRVPGLARFYGRALKAEKLDTLDKVMEALKAGDVLDLTQKDDHDRPWRLRYRRDGKVAVDGVKMSDRALVGKHGIGYNASGNWWEAHDLPKVLERFPVAAPKVEANAADLADEDESETPQSPMTGPSRHLPSNRGKAQIPVTPRMKPSAIIEKLRAALGGLPVSIGRFRQQAFGIYKQKPQAVRARLANDIQTIAHEFGHHVDHAILGISRKDKRWRDELKQLGQATSRPSYTPGQQRQEGAAEFFRLYLTEPDVAQKEAPEYFGEFEARLDKHPELKTLLHEARTDLQGLISQDPATRGALRIDFTGQDPNQAGVFKTLATDPKAAMRTLAVQWVDDLQALKGAVEAMRDGRPLDSRKNAYVLARNARGSSGMAEGMLEQGVRGRNGRFLSGSFADAITPVKDRLEDFAGYLVAQRVLEVRALKGKETGMTGEEARAIVKQIEQDPDRAAFEQARDSVYAYQNGLLQYAREYHALSDDQYRKLKQEMFYVPLQRVMDAVGGSFGATARKYANRTSPIKRMKGSGRDIVNPLESIIRNTFTFVDMVEKNRAMQALVQQAESAAGSAKWLEKVPTPQVATRFNLSAVGKDVRRELEDMGIDLPDNFDLDALVTVFTPAAFSTPGSNLVTVIRDGKREFWEIHDPALHDAIVALGPKAASKVLEWVEKPVRLLRAGATLTPGFIARNPLRDTTVAFLQSRYGFIPLYDTVRGFLDLALGTENAKLFVTSGVQQSSLVGMDRDRLRKKIEQMTERDKLAFFRHMALHPIDLLQALSENFESATRMGEFRLALNAGGTERRAGVLGILQRAVQPKHRAIDDETLSRATMAARDVTTDFSRGGSYSREMNRVLAFFNARVQGYVRMAETAKRDPSGTLVNMALLGLVSAALWWLNSDDDEYAELPDWEKNAYWHIPANLLQVAGLKKSGFIKVPKPFEWGATSNVIEAGLAYTKTHRPDSLNRLRPTDPAGFLATAIPTALLPMLEAYFNYDTFRDTHIVKPWDVGLDPEQQKSDWTTNTAVQIGKLTKVSPAKIDHMIFGYGAGFARGVVDYGTDPALSLMGISPKKDDPAKKAQRLPVVGTFYREGTFDGSSQSLRDFYDAFEKVDSFQKSMGRYGKSDIARGRERIQQERGESWFQRAEQIKTAKKLLEEHGQEVNAIYAAPASKLSPAQKRERLDRVYVEMVQTARWALGRAPLKTKQGPMTQTGAR